MSEPSTVATTDILKMCILNSDFAALQDLVGVSVHGFTGVGKSTYIQTMQGENFQYYEKDQTYKPQHRIKNITRPKVATQVRSTTISIHPYEAKLRIFFDMAGLAETRGKDFEMWSKFMLSTFYRLIGGIEATVIVLDCSNVTNKHAEDIKRLAVSLANTFGLGNKAFYESMCFVFTRPIAVKTSLLGTLVLTFLPMLLKMFVGGG